ncbi:cryptochrome/photolyase family protein [Rhizobium alvei]|uniref:Deoxyribodipyrimidine photo-lyase n=1 Tax=Rhizobium alvei TaxID=1132659 RepID=A0ABT8YK06_9HYPH|nr:deoxyribodipyrimidine photo-lyase [Rhizobium alvei]MDO6963978.1 deoxyribodipyrimidine photo-lyase [Rhizobium alvei]
MPKPDITSPASIVWFRRDLRLADNLALDAACRRGGPVICIFIREPGDALSGANGAAQAWWLHHSLERLDQALRACGNRLILRTGSPEEVLSRIADETGADCLFWNRRYDPDGIRADTDLKSKLREHFARVESFAGFLLHEPQRLLTKDGRPYQVYTPFWRALEGSLIPLDPIPAPTAIQAVNTPMHSDSLDDWALLPTKPDWASRFSEVWTPGEAAAQSTLAEFLDGAINGYKARRDVPAGRTTSLLSPHLAFGEISPHRIWHMVRALPDTIPIDDTTHFLKELVWRDFSWHLLFHRPDLATTNLNAKFDAFPWQDNEMLLAQWHRGLTGYPIVDAGMRQLWRHGWMHNRVRMVVASFLIKDLLIDWRHGERWFRDTLVDADQASNAASWQWVAGCGADAAPYFRIFNPAKQGETFDPDGAYIRAFCPELAKLPDHYIHRPHEAPSEILRSAGITLGKTYPHPMIAHDFARKRALEIFQSLGNS